MAATDRLTALWPYVERAASNDYVQERAAEAVSSLRAAYSRASRQSAAKAAQDRKLHRRIGRGLAAARDVAVTVGTGRKPKRRSRKPLVLGGLALVAAGAAAAGPLRERLAGDQATAPAVAGDGQVPEPRPEPSTV